MAKILNSDIQILSEEKSEEPQTLTLPMTHNEDINHLISFERKNQEIFRPNSLVSQHFMTIKLNYSIFSLVDFHYNFYVIFLFS